MRLVIEVDLDTIPQDTADEAGRILRYWAGALAQMDLTEPAACPLMNSSYDVQVGTLRLRDDEA